MNSKISAAKTVLVLDQPFFGSLLCHLTFREDKTCDTAWVDGTTFGYNPAYIETLTHLEVVGLICHEVLHCASGHPFRRDARDPKKWNVACDMAINPIVQESGMTLPNGSLQPTAEHFGKSAEYIFDRLPDNPNGDGGNGQGQPDKDGNGPSAPGEVRDSPSPDTAEEGEEINNAADWQQITREAATQAKAMGSLPTGLDRFAKQVLAPRVDWKAALRKFVQENAASDYTWAKPATRYIGQDLYLPSLRSESMPAIAIAVDTSGSMDEVSLAAAKAEVLAVVDETSPVRVTVLYADSQVARQDTFERGDVIDFRPAGGGGTDFRPVFEAIAAMDESPVCLIYITDLYGSFPDSPAEIPTLWVTDTENKVAPFGDTIKM